MSALPGAGLGYRPALHAGIFSSRAHLGFLEIVADHYLEPSFEKARELDLLADHFTLIPHALDLSLGSAGGLDERYLHALAALVDRLQPPWWSEHIAFTRSGAVEIGHLTPLPYTPEAVEAVCANIAAARRFIDAPLILENIAAPFVVPGATLSEGAFVRAILEQSDCGMLLDVANLAANAANHGYAAQAFLAELPLERVVQLHLAGGSRHEGRIVDSHAAPVADDVWQLAEEVVRRAPVRAISIERDADFGSFDELRAEVERAHVLGVKAGRWV